MSVSTSTSARTLALAISVAMLAVHVPRRLHADTLPATDAPVADSPDGGEDDAAKARTVAAAVWVLVGIAAVGVILLLATMVLGRTARRIGREPLPETRPPEPFEHLRPDPEPASESNVGDDGPRDD